MTEYCTLMKEMNSENTEVFSNVRIQRNES